MSTEIAKKSELQEALDLINAKLKAVVKIATTSYKTSGTFKYNPLGNAFIDLKKSTDIAALINVLAFIKAKHSGYNEAADALGLDSYPVFEWLGHTAEDWGHDIKLRIQVLNQVNTEKALKEAQSELSQYLSKEDKVNMILAKVSKL